MNILALTDLHGNVSKIKMISEKLAAADVVLLSGDITHFGHADEAKRIIDTIRQYSSQILTVSGNCDYHDVESYLSDEGLSIHRRNVVMDGIGFTGVSGSLPCPGKTPNELSEDEFEQYLREAISGLSPGIPVILLTHQPPFQTLNDEVGTGIHTGSKSIRNFIEQHKPLVCFTGHIHEGIGIDTIGKTKIVNPGPAGAGRYTLAGITDTVEILEIKEIEEEKAGGKSGRA